MNPVLIAIRIVLSLISYLLYLNFELNNGLSHNKSKSYVPDDIPFVFIQNIPFKVKTILLKIYNKL